MIRPEEDVVGVLMHDGWHFTENFAYIVREDNDTLNDGFEEGFMFYEHGLICMGPTSSLYAYRLKPRDA